MPKRTPPPWGKTAGKDAANDKPTYVTLLGPAAARQMAADLHRDAQEALASFGARAKRLGQLASYIIQRSY